MREKCDLLNRYLRFETTERVRRHLKSVKFTNLDILYIPLFIILGPPNRCQSSGLVADKKNQR